jgi:hypothetical protein
MRPGDLVVHEFCDTMPGILLEVIIDKKKMKSPFGIPWMYRVLWADGFVKEHEVGILRRIMIHETR